MIDTEDKTMKLKLCIQSFCPLYVLLLLFNINKWNGNAEFLSTEFFQVNWYIFAAKCILLILVALSIIFYFSFNSWSKYGQETHTKTTHTKNINAESLLFFVTFIIPIYFANFTVWQELLCCFVTLLIMMVLITKTTLYYQNPILTLLNYNLYSATIADKSIIIISKGKLKDSATIQKKQISENVYVAKEK